MTENGLLVQIAASIDDQTLFENVTSGAFAECEKIMNSDKDALVMFQVEESTRTVVFFGALNEMSQLEMQTFFATFPSDKEFKATLSVKCPYLVTWPNQAEEILDAFKGAFPDLVIVKTLDDSEVKGTVNI